MPDFTVHQYGVDPNGRPVFMTAYMHDWWEGIVADLGFRPTIVQGAFMTRAGGGAPDSAGYHDQGGCMDVRTWDLTASKIDALVRACRSHGGAAWRRDETAAHGGMASHCHITLGSDRPLSAGAQESWRSYLAGDNGLSNNARDYEWRPNPIVTKPPEDDMAQYADQLDAIQQTVNDTAKRVAQIGDRSARRDLALRDLIKKRFKATDAQLDEIFGAVEDD